MMRKCRPLPEENEAEDLSPSGILATPFSENMEGINEPTNGSAPDLVNHPHLDNSMRSMSTSVASRRKEYMQKRREAESQQQQRTGNMSRAERIAVMKRTRSVSTYLPIQPRFRVSYFNQLPARSQCLHTEPWAAAAAAQELKYPLYLFAFPALLRNICPVATMHASTSALDLCGKSHALTALSIKQCSESILHQFFPSISSTAGAHGKCSCLKSSTCKAS